MEPQQLIFQPSWPFYDVIYSNLELSSSSFSTPEEDSCLDQALLSVDDFLLDTEGSEPNFNGEMEFEYVKFNESETSSFPCSSDEGWSPTPSLKSNGGSVELNIPGGEMEIETELSILHLLKACGEAMENGQIELAQVIMKCVGEKVSLVGEPLLRLAFNLSEDFEKQHGDYLKQESQKNFEAAFRAFYQIFPYGRYAHLGSNSLILEAMPADAETLHIVDFDMGEGVQWPQVLEAAARLKKSVKLTAIKWKNERWSFEEAKRRLMEHGRSYGLNLKVVEIPLEDLVTEIKSTTKREWLAFNCMVGLPHMGRVTSRKSVQEFINIAQQLINNSVNRRGIITFGDGDGDDWETLRNCSGFGSFFQGKIRHYQAILESMEYSFPLHLAEARIGLESLFVAPFLSSQEWLQSWMEMKECASLKTQMRLEGCTLTRETLEEAREMVKGAQSFYDVRIGGELNNEMTLQWRGHVLVKLSAWTN
ncbi:protein NODULATION SIGNALING PATHWAY 2-like [Euphorbia lathyris]|uniref:protein NODULATION SIGNALING PATHWAY 2-like n=1 Tax=Euphorbia lathyris TaxID=212925 RepID=UPI0033135F28